jgi:hypothetical protein
MRARAVDQYKNPKWWDPENDSAWNRVKMVMKRELNQRSDLKDGKPYEEWESAYRFGYGARLKYGDKHSDWDANFETHLAEEWRALIPRRKKKWEQDRDAIRYGWNFNAHFQRRAAA